MAGRAGPPSSAGRGCEIALRGQVREGVTMKNKTAFLLGTAGVGLILALSGAAAAAPSNPWDEVAGLLRGVLSVEVVNSEPIAVQPVSTAVPDEPILLQLDPEVDDYVVPEGKLLVIQTVSFDVNVDGYNTVPEYPPGGTITVADFDTFDPDLKFFFFSLERGRFKFANTAQTTIYATAGKTILTQITPFEDSARVTISGVLRDSP